LNSRNTLMALLAQGIIPIINENDTVATEEIRVGDNDNLSALVANLIEADLLILLTDQEGFFTADPRRDPQAKLVDQVEGSEIPSELWQMAGGSASEIGTGGMLTKLQAADLARRSGVTVVIASGGDLSVISRLVEGKRSGTRFAPTGTALDSRQRYLLAGGTPSGTLRIDEGAVRALRRGNSLLPVGVATVEGDFERGDTVMVAGPSGKGVGRGLVNYPANDLRRILGLKSDQIESTLGFIYAEEVIHRNNLVIL
jgi:glutamate 5-kinase